MGGGRAREMNGWRGREEKAALFGLLLLARFLRALGVCLVSGLCLNKGRGRGEGVSKKLTYTSGNVFRIFFFEKLSRNFSKILTMTKEEIDSRPL